MGALVALSAASSAAASAVGRYAGRTSQRAPISFTVSRAHLRDLRFMIYIRCPSRHIWRISATNFPAIEIKHGTFGQRFVARGNKGSATVKGRLSGGRATGTLFDRTYEPKEHHFCAGTATFDLQRSGGAGKVPSRHGNGHGKHASREAKPA